MKVSLINDLPAIFVSALICFSLTAFWFSPALFGTVRRSELQKRDIKIPAEIDLRSYALLFGAMLLFCGALDFIVQQFSVAGIGKVLFVGTLLGVMLSAIHAATHVVYERRSIILFAIHTGHYLAVSIVGTAVLSMWE